MPSPARQLSMLTSMLTSLMALAAACVSGMALGPGPARAQAGDAHARAWATPEEPAGQALVQRLRRGGLVLFFRHADTTGMPCDRSFRLGDRPGQRNLSEAGREQSQRIGVALQALGIAVERPVLAGPVYRARDTAELAFGARAVRVTRDLLADDYAASNGAVLSDVLDAHRRLFTAPVGAGRNRVLVGHRTPAILVLGASVGGRAFPEGSALVLEPGDAAPRLLGILHPVPLAGRGFHAC